VPTFRPDLEREVDLIEEVARLIGYDEIPATLPVRSGVARGLYDRERHRVEDTAKEALEAAGFFEAVNVAFTSPTVHDAFTGGAADMRIGIQNPLGEDMSLLRASLLPGLLQNAAFNARRGHAAARLYEVSTIFDGRNQNGAKPALESADGPEGADAWAHERPRLAAVALGDDGARAFDQDGREFDFYDMKGALEELLEAVGLDVGLGSDDVSMLPSEAGLGYLHPRARAEVRVGDRLLGVLGEVHPDVLELFDIKQPAFAFELASDVLADVAPTNAEGKTPPRFPSVKRDFALVIDEDVAAGSLCRALAQHEAVDGLVDDIQVFDVYRGEHVPEGKKSVAFSLTLRAADRTLTDDEVTAAADALVKAAKDTWGAEIRA
jgi:phenylalanyl-tRNA synthetase beta chain